jgi:hypothetical protein
MRNHEKMASFPVFIGFAPGIGSRAAQAATNADALRRVRDLFR